MIIIIIQAAPPGRAARRATRSSPATSSTCWHGAQPHNKNNTSDDNSNSNSSISDGDSNNVSNNIKTHIMLLIILIPDLLARGPSRDLYGDLTIIAPAIISERPSNFINALAFHPSVKVFSFRKSRFCLNYSW